MARPQRQKPRRRENGYLDGINPRGECASGKHRYTSEKAAQRALDVISKRRTNGEAEKRWYYCSPQPGRADYGQFCYGYHLTHLDQIGV